MGPQGQQRGHLGVWGWIFINFGEIRGPSWGSIFSNLWFFLKFGATNLQGRFLGLFFNRFGCGNDTRIWGWTCWKHSKYCGFRQVSLFHVFRELDDIQSAYGCLFSSFLDTLGWLFLTLDGVGSKRESIVFFGSTLSAFRVTGEILPRGRGG